MDTQVKLSIIVPIYNVAEFLPKCIESILGQSFTEWELLLVDDGSTDESYQICEEFAQKDKRIKLFHKKNGGLISAKKEGLLHAKGEYVGFVDGDDWIEENMYELLHGNAADCHADIAIVDNVADFPMRSIKIKQGIAPGVYDKARLIQEVYPNLAFQGKLYSLGVSPSLCTKIFKKELITKYQFTVDERIKGGEDAACTYPCLLCADSMVYVGDCFPYHYRVHDKSMTHKKNILDLDERIALLTHLHNSLTAFDYPCVDRQLGLYAFSVIEGLVFRFFEYHEYRNPEKRKLLINQVTSNAAWKYVMALQKTEKLPSSTSDAISYLCNPTKSAFIKIYGKVKYNLIKRKLKRLVIKE